MSGKTSPSLLEYAQRFRKKPWHEMVPPEVVAEILEAHRQGVGERIIADWLTQEKGFADATRNKVQALLAAHRAGKV